MRRPSPTQQQGFGLLAFVIFTAILAFSFVIGYSGVMTRTQANQLLSNQRQYLEDVRRDILAYYEHNAYYLDNVSLSNPVTADTVLKGASIRIKYGLQAEVSNTLTTSEGLAYRAVAIWVPAETDADNPPDLTRFKTTGVFQSCMNPSSNCAERQYLVFDSSAIERDLQKQTTARLERIAMKAESYFKAQILQDPEKNVSVNYFRPVNNTCSAPFPSDIECMDTYKSLVGTVSAKNLSLSPDETVSAWGMPIEASNLLDSNSTDTPYTMSFRAITPAGTYLSIKAIEPL